ncbi:class I SAM-dependent methyltransferase [Candidatus Pelagibacter sp.]|nr:class I SAM-dependent methyltransferase [Candidatus Pelagibacter sp.]
MIKKFINLFLKKKVVKLYELPERVLNKINYFLQFPRAGFGRHFVDKFIKEISKEFDKDGQILLDVGAGHQPYKKNFKKIKYESCDSDNVIKEIKYDILNAKHDFYCNINEHIPRNDKYYDVVLCSEVLEHVYNPENVIKEISRILKDDGVFIATIPQSMGEHMLPHNYFNYLGPGILYLLKKNNLKALSLKKYSGVFHATGNLLNKLVNTVFFIDRNLVTKIIFFPLEFIVRIFVAIINIILFYLDKFDTTKSWSLHYFLIAKKN